MRCLKQPAFWDPRWKDSALHATGRYPARQPIRRFAVSALGFLRHWAPQQFRFHVPSTNWRDLFDGEWAERE